VFVVGAGHLWDNNALQTVTQPCPLPPPLLPQVITYEKSLRTAEYAFEFAYLNNRRRVTAVHKANIMKKGDGMFLKVCVVCVCGGGGGWGQEGGRRGGWCACGCGRGDTGRRGPHP
jgi:hypothetical protein